MHIVIGAAFERGVGVWHPPLLGSHIDSVAGHHIESTCLQGGDALAENEGLAWEILRHVFRPLMVVVKPDDVDGTALEEVVARIGLVAAGGDRPCGVIPLDNLGQVTGEQRVDTQLVFFGQGRGVMPSIEDEVGLLEGERVGLCRRPLLQHFIADTPHQNGGVVAVTQDEVGEVALMPFVKEAGVVVLGLLASPHVKRLVHDDESHCVAQVEQFGGGWVVRTTDGIDAHLFEDGELAVHRVFVKGGAKAS